MLVNEKRVLAIDLDNEKPTLYQYTGVSNEPGLAGLLVGQSRTRDAMQRTNNPLLCVLPAGRRVTNWPELLVNDRMVQLIRNLNAGPFDVVIFYSAT